MYARYRYPSLMFGFARTPILPRCDIFRSCEVKLQCGNIVRTSASNMRVLSFYVNKAGFLFIANFLISADKRLSRLRHRRALPLEQPMQNAPHFGCRSPVLFHF